MVVFEVGGRTLTEGSFRHVIEAEIEKLVEFFGEEYRAKIEEKIYNSNYVIADRKRIDSNSKSINVLHDFLKEIGADLAPDLLRNHDENSTLKFINKFKEWALSSPNVKDNVEYRAFWASYFENLDTKDFDTYQGKYEHFLKMRAKFNDPEFIENLQKRIDSIQSFQVLKEAFGAWIDKRMYYEYYKLGQSSEYAAQLKWYLNSKQILCRQELARVFGKNKLLDIIIENENEDISKTFIDYITKKPELRSSDDEFDYKRMFDELTGEHLSLQEYETKYEKQIAQISSTLHEKFEKMDNEKDSGLIRGTLSKLEEYLKNQGVKDVDDAINRFIIYMKKLDDAAAYHSSLETENGRINFVALPEDFQFSLTHETLHAISSDENSNKTGFDNHETTTALNEVITEFLALKIDNRKAENLDSKLTCNYSAAFPLMEEFLNKNLDKIKTFYLNGDVESFKKFIGAENFEQLCQNLTELLNLSKKIPHLTLNVQQILKDPLSCKNEKLKEAVNNIIKTMQSIEKFVDQKVEKKQNPQSKTSSSWQNLAGEMLANSPSGIDYNAIAGKFKGSYAGGGSSSNLSSHSKQSGAKSQTPASSNAPAPSSNSASKANSNSNTSKSEGTMLQV